MRTIRASLLLGFILGGGALGACGGDGGGNAPSLDTICEEDGLYADLINKLLECNPLFAIILGAEVTPAEISTACYGAMTPFLEDGTVQIGDSAAFEACAALLETATCEDLGRQADDPCSGVLVGTVAPGGLCDTDDQCADDAFCDIPDPDMCGTCTALKADGATCEVAPECRSGRCTVPPDPGDPLSMGTCQPLLAIGGTCDVDADCLGTAFCSSTGQCTAQGNWAVGSPCDDIIQDCGSFQEGLYCDPMMSQCRTIAQLGETCSDPFAGADPWCNLLAYEHCEETTPGTFECVAPTIVNQGDECDIFNGLQCADGLRCDDHDATMATPTQCITPLQEGDTCLETNPLCDFLLNCINGVCQYGEHTGICPAAM